MLGASLAEKRKAYARAAKKNRGKPSHRDRVLKARSEEAALKNMRDAHDDGDGSQEQRAMRPDWMSPGPESMPGMAMDAQNAPEPWFDDGQAAAPTSYPWPAGDDELADPFSELSGLRYYDDLEVPHNIGDLLPEGEPHGHIGQVDPDLVDPGTGDPARVPTSIDEARVQATQGAGVKERAKGEQAATQQAAKKTATRDDITKKQATLGPAKKGDGMLFIGLGLFGLWTSKSDKTWAVSAALLVYGLTR